MKGVYIVQFDTYPGVYKIGKSKDIESRFKQFTQDTVILGNVKLIYKREFEDYSRAEKDIHELLKNYRVQKNREFFKGDIKIFINVISNLNSEDYRYSNKEENVHTKIYKYKVPKKIKLGSPGKYLKSEGLEFKDLLIYAHFRKYMNEETLQTFVSIDTIVADSKISKPTILRAIKRLEKANYFTISKVGKFNCYTFKNKNQLIYTFEYLNNKSISNVQKAIRINLQKYNINANECSEYELANINNLDIRTFHKIINTVNI